MKTAECFMPVTIMGPDGPRELWERTTYQVGTDSKVRMVMPGTEKYISGYVADYLTPDPFSMNVSGKCSHWRLKTHPIGLQPEGAVLVPGSEREVTE